MAFSGIAVTEALSLESPQPREPLAFKEKALSRLGWRQRPPVRRHLVTRLSNKRHCFVATQQKLLTNRFAPGAMGTSDLSSRCAMRLLASEPPTLVLCLASVGRGWIRSVATAVPVIRSTGQIRDLRLRKGCCRRHPTVHPPRCRHPQGAGCAK